MKLTQQKYWTARVEASAFNRLGQRDICWQRIATSRETILVENGVNNHYQENISVIFRSCRRYWRSWLRPGFWFYLPLLLPVIGLSIGANPAGVTVSVVHLADVSNITGNYTQIANPGLDGNSELIVFATARRSGPGTPSVTAPIGVWFSGGRWHVFTEDRSPMPVGAEFNIVGMPAGRNAFVHTANASNTQSHITRISVPEINGNAKATLTITQVFSPGGAAGLYNPHPTGVFYDGTSWCIFNQDMAPMPLGAAFDVSFENVQTVTEEKGELSTRETDPERILIVTQNWNPRGQTGVYNASNVGVKFKAGQWAIENLSRSDIASGASFNVLAMSASSNAVVLGPSVLKEQIQNRNAPWSKITSSNRNKAEAGADAKSEITNVAIGDLSASRIGALAPPGGVQFDPNLSNSDGASTDPRIAVSGSSVFVVWREQTSTVDHICFTKSLTNGRNFEEMKELSRANVSAYSPRVVARGNTVFVFYLEERDVWYRQSDDAGQNFGPEVNISASPESPSFDLDVVVDDRSVFIAWAEQKGTTGQVGERALRFRRIDSGGMGPLREIGAQTNSDPRLAIRGNLVVMTFTSEHARDDLDTSIAISSNRGNTWRVDESAIWGNFGNQQFARPYILPSGDVQFTYESRPPGHIDAVVEDLGSAQRDPISDNRAHTLFLNGHGLNSGITGLIEGNRDPMQISGAILDNELANAWTQYDGRRRSLYLYKPGRPVSVLNTTGVDPRNASIINAGGDLAIVYTDRRSVGAPEEVHLIQAGSNFSNTNLSDTPGRSLDPQIAVNDRFMFVVWMDDTPGNFDIFFKAVPIVR